MSGRIVIFGYGPVGRATAARLLAEGSEVEIAQRNPPPDLADGLIFTPCDALNRESVVKASRGARQFVVAIGLPYNGAVWRAAWPRAMSNFVAAAEANGARMVFVDNLYMYGPQTAPLVETMPLTDFGAKPAARAAATRVWTEAALTGRACVAALRAPDFYGPGVGQSYLGDATIGALAKGKAATFIGSPEILHDYAYVPDVARAVSALLAAPDSAFGQAWHVPCAPTRTTRQILEMVAEALGVRLRIHQLPASLLRPAGLFSPFLRELVEMRFQWDRPYCVVASRFARAFWSDATPFETGVELTALAFRAAAEAERRQKAPRRRSEAPKGASPPRGGDPRKRSGDEPRKSADAPSEAAVAPPKAADAPPKAADAPPKSAVAPPPEAAVAPPKAADAPPNSAVAPPPEAADDAPPKAPVTAADTPPEGAEEPPPDAAEEPPQGGEAPPTGGKRWGKKRLPQRRLQGLEQMPRIRSSRWSSLLRR